MRFRAGLALCGALLTAGCAVPYSPAPVATNFPSTQQAKLQAAAQWGVIARHMAGQLAPSLKVNAKRPLYVSSQQSSAFAQGVSAHLVTALVNDGYIVVKVPDANTLRIELDTQVLAFSADRPQYKFATGATPRNEIVVNLTLADDARYYARATSVYYTTDSDRTLYQAAIQPSRTFPVRNH